VTISLRALPLTVIVSGAVDIEGGRVGCAVVGSEWQPGSRLVIELVARDVEMGGRRARAERAGEVRRGGRAG
jgi:hypothetical protein